MTYSDGGRGRPDGAYAPQRAQDTFQDYQYAEPVEAEAYAAYETASAPRGLQSAVHMLGAAASLALVAGLCVWGYGQVVRDVAGVPVVEALDGPMRIAPEQPGGQISDHAGLSVNQIKAGEAAGEVPPEVHLAPAEVPMIEEDQPASTLSPGPAQEQESLPVVEASLTTDPGELRPLGPAPALGVPLAEAGEEPIDATAAAIEEALSAGLQALDLEPSGPPTARAVSASPRPQPRPARTSAAVPAATAPPGPSLLPQSEAGEGAEVASRAALDLDTAALAAVQVDDTAPVPAGTRLVQFGAYDSADEARVAWGDIAGRFAPMMEDKTRVVQESEAGGRPFWRLRAGGFADLASARRFCAALVAERTECIPVVAR